MCVCVRFGVCDGLLVLLCLFHWASLWCVSVTFLVFTINVYGGILNKKIIKFGMKMSMTLFT